MEVFKAQLDNLDKIAKNLKKQVAMEKQVTKEAKNFDKVLSNIKKTTDVLFNTFNRLFSLLKTLSFSSVLSGGLLALKGVWGQKEAIKSQRLGLQTQELGALKYAGGETMAERDFYVDMLKSLKESLYTPEKDAQWAMLGINAREAQSLDSLELLKKFLSEAKGREGGDVGQNLILSQAISSLAGIDLGTLKTIDFDKFTKAYEKGLTLTDNSANKLAKVGEGVNTLMTSIDTLVNKSLASISPAIGKVLDTLAVGIAKLGKNEAFTALLDKISNWALDLAEGFDDKLMSAIKDIPSIVRGIQLVFFKILDGLASAAKVFTLGLNDSVNEFKVWASKGIKDIEMKNKFEEVQQATSIPEWKQKLGEYVELKGKDISQEEKEKFAQRYVELKQMPPINITIQNDPSQGIVQKNLTDALNYGGIAYPTYQGLNFGNK